MTLKKNLRSNKKQAIQFHNKCSVFLWGGFLGCLLGSLLGGSLLGCLLDGLGCSLLGCYFLWCVSCLCYKIKKLVSKY